MQPPEHETAAREAIRHWSRLTELAEFAALRHGFGNSDGGFGVTYSEDLDQYDRVMDGICIPKGFVLAYGFWGLPNGYEVLIPETIYLVQLAVMLSEAGHAVEAKQVRTMAETLESE